MTWDLAKEVIEKTPNELSKKGSQHALELGVEIIEELQRELALTELKVEELDKKLYPLEHISVRTGYPYPWR